MKALKKDMKATSEEILALEENSDLNNERNKIYNFSNGDIYIGKINKSKLDGQGVYIVNDDKFGFEYIGEFKDDEKYGRETLKSCLRGNFRFEKKFYITLKEHPQQYWPVPYLFCGF